jgi:hypothetical protein
MITIAFALLCLLLLLAVAALIYRRTSASQNVMSTVQSLLTAAAILLAGFWYFIERKGMSHAEVHLSATGVHMAEGIALVQLRIETKNVGYIMLHANEWDVRLLSVLPNQLPLDTLAGLKLLAWPAQIDKAEAYYAQELAWTPVRAFQGYDRHDIEPGESDLKAIDFVVPCTLRVGELTAALRKLDMSWDWDRLMNKLRGKENEQMWWKDRLVFNLAGVCDGPIGSVAHLGEGGGVSKAKQGSAAAATVGSKSKEEDP